MDTNEGIKDEKSITLPVIRIRLRTDIYDECNRLFIEREEIPPEAVRNMMLYCLDCHSKEGIPGKRGTSRAAMMFLSNWLNEYGELGIDVREQ